MSQTPAQLAEEKSRIKIKDLIAELSLHSPDAELNFGCTRWGDPLSFCRVKQRADDLVQIELQELFDDEIITHNKA